MNLVNDPWIPVVFQDGGSSLVSLNDAFALGYQIRDLNVLPHERVAVMRLLVCVTQAALNGPNTYMDWLKCKDQIATVSQDYLRNFGDRFELFGEGERFLQLEGLSLDESKTKKKSKKSGGDEVVSAKAETSKLDLSLASGNNHTLFDNAATAPSREISKERLALTLLSFQCFAPGSLIGVGLWNGQSLKGSSIHAPCSGSIIHAIIREESLIGTIHSNLITKDDSQSVHGNEGWGVPIWEAMPRSQDDQASIKNATETYLGRLLPISRAIRLLNQRSMIIANGLAYRPYPAFREATISTQLRKSKGQEQLATVMISPRKAIWRELHSIVMKNKGELAGPLIWGKFSGDRDVDLWTGALCCNKSKIIDSIESNFSVPSAMFGEIGGKIYEEGVLHAVQQDFNLSIAIRTYAETLRIEPKTISRMKEAASLRFWTAVESGVKILLEQVATFRETDSWNGFIRRHMEDAYEVSCPHTTSRQIEAFSRGRNRLSNLPYKKTTRDKK